MMHFRLVVFIFILSLLLCSLTGRAQNHTIEDLISQLDTEKNPKERANIFKELNRLYLKNDKLLAKNYALKFLAEANRTTDTLLIIQSEHTVGNSYRYLNMLDSAMYFNESALEKAVLVGDSLSIANGYNGLGVLASRRGYLEESLNFYKRALIVGESTENLNLLGKVYNNIGLVYQKKGNDELALEYFIKSIELKEGITPAVSLIPSYNNIGLVYMNMHHFQNAEEYFLKGLEIADTLNDDPKKAILYTNLGQVNMELDLKDESIRYFNQSIHIRSKSGDEIGLAVTYIHFANLWLKLKDYKRAIRYYHNAYELLMKNNTKSNLDRASFHLGRLNYELERYDEAEVWFSKSIEISHQVKSTAFLIDSYDYLSKIKYIEKNMESAYHYLKLAKVIGDSIAQSETDNRIAELRVKYESEYNRKTINNLRQVADYQEREKQRNYLLFVASFAALLATLVIAVLVYRQYHIAKQGRDKLDELNHELEHKNEALNSAITKANEALKVKSEFIASVSHEIRTPMNAIIGMGRILKDTDLSEEQTKYMDTIANSSSNLMILLNDILDFSKIEANKMELDMHSTNLKDMLKHLEVVYKEETYKKGVSFDLVFPADLPTNVYTDGPRLRQVLVNLLSNATKFTQEGRVILELSVYNRERTLNGELVDIRFEVRDTGIGISTQKMQRIFESFQQADASISKTYGGVGLGLSISQRLVSMMGAKLLVQSTEGEGSSFYFILRLRTAKSNLDNQSKSSLSSDLAEEYPARILIAEDNELNMDLMQITLSKMGYDPVGVYNGQEVLDILATGQEFDIIFMDIQMPVMGGVEAASKVMQLYGENAPVIIASTADAMGNSKENYLNAGMDDYISKPFQIEQLVQLLKRWVLRKK